MLQISSAVTDSLQQAQQPAQAAPGTQHIDGYHEGVHLHKEAHGEGYTGQRGEADHDEECRARVGFAQSAEGGDFLTAALGAYHGDGEEGSSGFQVGKIYDGKVTGVTKFGAFVEVEKGVTGMVARMMGKEDKQ